MKIGIVGYQGSGKSSLFEWLTGVVSDPARAHLDQSAMAQVPDERFEPLRNVYKPKKLTRASLELVDTPGLGRTHEGNAARLALIREASSLVIVVAAFDGSDPAADLTRFEDDLLLADLDIVTGRVEKLRASVKKARPGREEEQAQLAALEPLVAILETGRPVHEAELSDDQIKATRSFGLLTQKPRLVIVNVADDEEQPHRFTDLLAGKVRALAIPIGLELELARMSEEDRTELVKDMGLTEFDRDGLMRTIMDVSGQMLFFTAGEKELRTWILPRGGTAIEAAGSIHTDMARGFIRAEVMQSDDLIRLGSERELKAQNLVRQEPKDYVVQDGEILFVKFNV